MTLLGNLSWAAVRAQSLNCDDAPPLQKLLDAAGTVRLEPGRTYHLQHGLHVRANTTLEGNGATLDASSLDGKEDTLLIAGSESPVKVGRHIVIQDLALINNPSRYGLHVFGEGMRFAPSNVAVRRIRTEGNALGGILLNSCSHILMDECENVGGRRHIGIKAPRRDPEAASYITIHHCRTRATSAFGYQLYYGSHLSVISCKVDGQNELREDRSGITVDRSVNAYILDNEISAAPTHQIYVTGARDVLVANNVCKGGRFGIQVAANWEAQEDPDVKESSNIELSGNTLTNSLESGIMLNGVINALVSDNKAIGSPSNGIVIRGDVRKGDSYPMRSTGIVLIGNELPSRQGNRIPIESLAVQMK